MTSLIKMEINNENIGAVECFECGDIIEVEDGFQIEYDEESKQLITLCKACIHDYSGRDVK